MRFIVPGQPLPAERPRTVRRGNKRVTITPDRTLAAEARVAAAFRAAFPDHTPDATTVWSVDARFYRETHTSADVDNLLKTVLDGLNGVLWADDAQVAEVHAVRHLGVGRGLGRTLVEVMPLTVVHLGESATLVPTTRRTPNGA